MSRVLVTCPPMLGMKQQFMPVMDSLGFEVHCPDFHQTMSVDELIELVPKFDGWIIGDDPATRAVFEAGRLGKLRSAVKWGVGTDNVDFDACHDLGIKITNTPGMFGPEVADMAVGYLIALARETFSIDRGIRSGRWPKPRGVSLQGKTVGLIGFGDIGRNTASRLAAFGVKLKIYDPDLTHSNCDFGELEVWPNSVEHCDFLVFTCALTSSNVHMLNDEVISRCKNGVRIINVARGRLIDEIALVKGLETGKVYSAALDVFETEPLPSESYLLRYDRCILGSHNSSNTEDAVAKTNLLAIEKLAGFLGE